MIRIHDFARGARGLRVVWQCEEMGLPYRFETVSFPPSAAYLALNPLGSVPFLEDDGGAAGVPARARGPQLEHVLTERVPTKLRWSLGPFVPGLERQQRGYGLVASTIL